MENEVKDAIDALNSTWEADFKKADEERRADIEKLGTVTGEAVQKMERVQDRLDGIEAAIEKLRTGTGRTDGDGDRDEKRAAQHAAFMEYVKKGERGDVEVLKGLVVSDDTEGGYLAPVEFVSELVQGVVELSPFRQIAGQRTTTARAISYPKRTGRLTARWTGETETRTETTGTAFGKDEIPTHEMYAFVDVSRADLADTAIDLEAYLRDEMALAFADLEGTDGFIDGNGVKKPHGFLNQSDILADYVPLGHASQVTADGLIDLFYDLKAPYSANATWIMARGTVRAIRKLKDTSSGNYLWAPGIAGSAPATILDRPYLTDENMPTVGANEYPVALGDFRRGYLIVDRMGMDVIRDDVTQAATGMVRFHAHRRVGGQVRIPEAIKLGKVATS